MIVCNRPITRSANTAVATGRQITVAQPAEDKIGIRYVAIVNLARDQAELVTFRHGADAKLELGARTILAARDKARGDATLARFRDSAPGIAHPYILSIPYAWPR
jgi:hypothetical protein